MPSSSTAGCAACGPVWTPPGREPKEDPPGLKIEARRLTRIRRLRYYPLRVVDGTIEVAVPA